jgi:hypothetical protein
MTPRRVLVAFVLLWAILGCAIGSTPSSGPFICSPPNAWGERMEVFIQDDWRPVPNTVWLGVVDPGAHFCTTWNLPGNRGRWGMAPLDGPVKWKPYFHAFGLR